MKISLVADKGSINRLLKVLTDLGDMVQKFDSVIDNKGCLEVYWKEMPTMEEHNHVRAAWHFHHEHELLHWLINENGLNKITLCECACTTPGLKVVHEGI